MTLRGSEFYLRNLSQPLLSGNHSNYSVFGFIFEFGLELTSFRSSFDIVLKLMTYCHSIDVQTSLNASFIFEKRRSSGLKVTVFCWLELETTRNSVKIDGFTRIFYCFFKKTFTFTNRSFKPGVDRQAS
jgi:hypothetical protein